MYRTLKNTTVIMIAALTVLLSACAKQPKDVQVLVEKKPVTVIKISPNTPYDSFYKRLSRALHKAELQIGDYRQTTIPTLHILYEDVTTEALEFDVNDKLRREEVSYELEFKVTDKNGNTLISSTKLYTSKEHKINPHKDISILNERDMITYELQQDLIQKIIAKLKEINLPE